MTYPLFGHVIGSISVDDDRIKRIHQARYHIVTQRSLVMPLHLKDDSGDSMSESNIYILTQMSSNRSFGPGALCCLEESQAANRAR